MQKKSSPDKRCGSVAFQDPTTGENGMTSAPSGGLEIHYVNGCAISNNPEDRHEPESGELIAAEK
jgi:hypothetical protein